VADNFSHEEQAKRLYGLGELEREALAVLRFIVRQTERGENLDAEIVERAKAIVDRYDRDLMRGHEAPGVVPFWARLIETMSRTQGAGYS
jgi:hypothetical protein